ncbi:hypothetical protein CMUS01_11843 [Colletotrichum musicola]|uniref:Uncharacterized protein n=1 Tax=Colletotrichum musicola TaxID=2175873 RepID=A0A8H6JU89_9PEZI|nr:hypothetical protein CMUS01_11843 [Colletotrichum musicola]
MTSKTAEDPLERFANNIRDLLDKVEAVREKERLERSAELSSAKALPPEATRLQASPSGNQLASLAST